MPLNYSLAISLTQQPVGNYMLERLLRRMCRAVGNESAPATSSGAPGHSAIGDYRNASSLRTYALSLLESNRQSVATVVRSSGETGLSSARYCISIGNINGSELRHIEDDMSVRG
jgi:hypothetical protein